jgi:hypothetical protein
MYAATTKDKGNAADGRFSTACIDFTIPEVIPLSIQKGGCENYLFIHIFVK